MCRVVVDMGGDSHWLRLHICFFSNRAHSYAHWNLFRSTLLALLHMFHPARDNCLQMKGMTAKHNVTPEIIYNLLCTLGLLSFHRCCSKPKKGRNGGRIRFDIVLLFPGLGCTSIFWQYKGVLHLFLLTQTWSSSVLISEVKGLPLFASRRTSWAPVWKNYVCKDGAGSEPRT